MNTARVIVQQYHPATLTPRKFAPVWMVLARPLLALAMQGSAVILFKKLQFQAPAVIVRNWWTVYGTLIDIACLALLFWLTRTEGTKLFKLISFDKRRIKKDLLHGIGIFIVVFPLAVFGGSMLAGKLAYGSFLPSLPEGAFIRTLPLWAVIYSRTIWWVIWSFTEELTFQGYALSRLQVLTRYKWLAVLWVAFGWSLQHSFLPFIDLRHALYLFIMFLPLTLALQWAYLRLGRLMPVIIAHWLMDLSSVLFMVQILV
jgi:membrane protease YdiL (CAAX protease family)